MTTDHDIWQEFIKGLKPLARTQACGENKPAKDVKIRQRDLPFVEPQSLPSSVLICGGTADIDRNLRRKMDKGEYPIDGILDLHNYTLEQAYEKLLQFIQKAYSEELRLVLLIVGKGKRSENGRRQIRSMLPIWLNQSSLRAKIVRFCPATPRDGGEGAVYILLRRHRR